MQVRLFGELEAEQAGVPVPVHGAKQRALLALLALRAGQPVSADQLIDALWGDGQAATRPTPCRPRSASCAVPSVRQRSSPPTPAMPLMSVQMMSTRPVLSSWWQRDGACLRRGR